MDQYNNNENLYNNENQQKQFNQQSTQPLPGSPYPYPGGGTPAPYRPRKRGIGTKGIVAIILCCAVLFGGIGFGSAWYLKETGSDNTQTEAALDVENPDADTDTTKEDTTSQSDLSLKMAKEEEGALTIPQITEKSADSVVEITTETVQTGTMLQQYISSGAGSGVIITEDGYILTNHHVIEGATNISITLRSGETYPAELIGLDEQLDVALLKVEATGLSAASIGTSSDLVVGQTVVAIGNPLGQLGGTVTDGIISALDRNITLNGETHNLLQTNAAVNPGNSGGGLFDAQGNLIALVVAKSGGENVEGIGFAIPIDDVLAILDDLKEHGYVTGRVSLGLSIVDINSNQMAWMYRVNELGTYIYSLTADSSAAQAGLQPGDRIVSVNGTEIGSYDDLKALLETVSVSDELTFVVSRSGQTLEIPVIAGEYVPEQIQKQNNSNI
ncbi:MAG: trypsin-like peptidase domain-containing protein [Firmicutes bacterium]|nr:trypsin-like peptidase domain-containing protein [Bacillota bacterium]